MLQFLQRLLIADKTGAHVQQYNSIKNFPSTPLTYSPLALLGILGNVVILHYMTIDVIYKHKTH